MDKTQKSMENSNGNTHQYRYIERGQKYPPEYIAFCIRKNESILENSATFIHKKHLLYDNRWRSGYIL